LFSPVFWCHVLNVPRYHVFQWAPRTFFFLFCTCVSGFGIISSEVENSTSQKSFTWMNWERMTKLVKQFIKYWSKVQFIVKVHRQDIQHLIMFISNSTFCTLFCWKLPLYTIHTWLYKYWNPKLIILQYLHGFIFNSFTI
jgi:hypothetical protein